MTMTVGGKEVKGVTAYLEAMVELKKQFNSPKDYYYPSIEAFLLAHGKHYKPHSRPKGVKLGPAKLCFMNAFLLANDNPDAYTYVEGFAVPKGIGLPLEHAWCVDKDGNVIDNTWGDATEYFGVPFKIDAIRRVLLDKGTYGIIDDWEHKHPILKIKKWHGIMG